MGLARLKFFSSTLNKSGLMPEEVTRALLSLPINSKIIDFVENQTGSDGMPFLTIMVENDIFKDGSTLEPIYSRKTEIVNGKLHTLNWFIGLN